MKVTLRRPDDMHVHLRDGDMLRNMVKYTSRHFSTALVMPNTTKPILTRDDAMRYRSEIIDIHAALREAGSEYKEGFTPLMTIKLTGQTSPEIIKECEGKVIAAKLYPEGVTTNSQDGIRTTESLYPVFQAMEDIDMVLCIHGEKPGVFTLDRESAYLKTVLDISRAFPRLRIVLEHITTEEAMDWVLAMPDNVAATITVHHLFITLDDVLGGALRPHLFCKPVAKRASDRDALRWAAMCGSPKFFLGTDSAPHLVGKKECASGCAGVFTAPVAVSCLAELFEDKWGVLEDFSGKFGACFYGVSAPQTTITLEDDPWVVPDQYDGVVPFRAGETLKWRVSA